MKKEETLEERQQKMLERKKELNREAQQRSRLRKQLLKVAGPDAQVRVEVLRDGENGTPREIKDILAKLKEALGALEGLTPDEIHEKVTALTQVLHIKLQLQVSSCLDALGGDDPDMRVASLGMIEILMPFITQITELNVKMQVAMGLSESKGKLLGAQKRQPLALPSASPQVWEEQFGDTLTNKSIN